MGQTRAVLKGCGIAIPPVEIDNNMLAKVLETSDEWIRERSGIITRYFVEPGVGTSDLGAEAAQKALDDAGMKADEIDYIVCATMTPDHYFPGAGTMIQARLGMSPIPTLDIRQQCAGFAYGMQTVDALIRSGIAKNVLLVGAEVHSCLMPFTRNTWSVLLGETDEPVTPEEFAHNSKHRHLVVLFGDGAGAMVFSADEDSSGRGIVGSRLLGDGEHCDILVVPGVGSKRRPWVDAEMIANDGAVPRMDGRQVFRLAVTKMPAVTKEVLAEHGLGLEDLDLLLMHQANLRINEAAQKSLDLPDEKVHNTIHKFGNTTAGTLPIGFHEARAAGKVKDGDLIAFTALGAGLHWGSVLLRV